MKNVKMLLTAAVVLTVVGGTLAFKPHATSDFCLYMAQDNVCKFVDVVNLDSSQPPVAQSLIIENNDCPDLFPLESCNQTNRVISEQ